MEGVSMTRDVFGSLEIRVGLIVEVEDFPQARKPAFRLTIDFGEFGVKRSSAQLTRTYTKEGLKGKRVLCVTNIAPLRVGPFVSEVLVPGIARADGVWVLVVPDGDIPLGTKLE